MFSKTKIKIVVNLFLVFFFLFGFSSLIKGTSGDNLVNIYFFHLDSCSHCNEEKKLLNELERDYRNVRVYSFEVSDAKNRELLDSVSEMMGTEVSGVPFTVMGDKYYRGYSGFSSRKEFIKRVSYLSCYGYRDLVGEFLEIEELPREEFNKDQVSYKEYEKTFLQYKLWGGIDLGNLDIEVVILVMGVLLGLNIVNLLGLIGCLIGGRKWLWGPWVCSLSYLVMVVWLELVGYNQILGLGLGVYVLTLGIVTYKDKRIFRTFFEGIIIAAWKKILESCFNVNYMIYVSKVIYLNTGNLGEKIIYYLTLMGVYFIVSLGIVLTLRVSKKKIKDKFLVNERVGGDFK